MNTKEFKIEYCALGYVNSRSIPLKNNVENF